MICPDCGEKCNVIALDNSFDYAGTHCTHGRSGTHYPDGYGDPVSDCCEAYIEDMEDYGTEDDFDMEYEMMKAEYLHDFGKGE